MSSGEENETLKIFLENCAIRLRMLAMWQPFWLGRGYLQQQIFKRLKHFTD